MQDGRLGCKSVYIVTLNVWIQNYGQDCMFLLKQDWQSQLAAVVHKQIVSLLTGQTQRMA